jgi:hypothetical protein
VGLIVGQRVDPGADSRVKGIACAGRSAGSSGFAGREPVERDTLYNMVTGPDELDEVRARNGTMAARN